MIFYDFEVFKHDWLGVFIDVTHKKEHVIINNPDELKALYEANKNDIWVGFNNRHYDQYIMKGILLGMNPKKINDFIVVQGGEGWQFSNAFNKVPMINYDVMPNPPVGLKTMEAFLGSNIKETEVPFDIDRPLTQKEIEQTIFYCRHDVEQTIKVFLEKVDDFNAMHEIVKAFKLPLSCIGDSEARITAKVLGCQRQTFDDEFEVEFLPCIRLKKYKYVQEWFEKNLAEIRDTISFNRELAASGQGRPPNEEIVKRDFYKNRSLTTMIAGIPHTFGFGGLHGASDKPIHRTGAIYHVDVGNYYPSCGDVTIRALLEECIGYCFYRRNELGKAFILTGDKSNGKSTFLDVLKHILGEGNISALDLKELGDRFNTSMMFGKLANIGDDIGDDFLQGSQVSIFKKIVTGNRIKAERKGQDPFEFNPYIKLLFAANDIPRMKDKTGAVLRRLVIIPFNASFSKSDPDYDPFIKYKLVSQDAIEYMIQLGIAGLIRILENNEFTKSEKVQNQLDEYEEENNPIIAFIADTGVDMIEDEPTNEVYKRYQVFCADNAMTPMSNIVFSKQINKRLGLEINVVKLNGKTRRIFRKV